MSDNGKKTLNFYPDTKFICDLERINLTQYLDEIIDLQLYQNFHLLSM